MEKYFAKISCGAGMTTYELLEAVSYEQAETDARHMCVDFAQEYGYEQDEDYFGDLDQLGKEWDEDEGEYQDISELVYYVDLYDPEEHDGWLS